MQRHIDAAGRRHQQALAQAWHTAAFGRLRRLRPLQHYLTMGVPHEPPPPPSPEDRQTIVSAVRMWADRLNHGEVSDASRGQ